MLKAISQKSSETTRTEFFLNYHHRRRKHYVCAFFGDDFMSEENDKNKQPSYHIYSVHENKNGKAYFHRLGSTYEHKDNEGHTLDQYSVPKDKNAKIVIRTTKERLEAKRQGKEGQNHNNDGRER